MRAHRLQSIGFLTICIFASLHAVAQATQTYSQSQPSAKEPVDPNTWTYGSKSVARAFGNVGGWWSFMNENEKAAFLDGYQAAMKQALDNNDAVCKAIQESVKPTVSQQTFSAQFSIVVSVCGNAHESASYEKVTVKDLDEFYGNPINQRILLEWAMGFLRDKASGAKTEGQLLDTLKEKQKERGSGHAPLH